MYYAHSANAPDHSDWQCLSDHLQAVARLAAERGNKFGAAKAAHLAGLLHDLGKYAAAFQAYIDKRSPLSVDHATAGAREVFNLGAAPADRAMAQLLAYAIAGHHAGLPDRSGSGEATLDHRIVTKTIEPLDPAWLDEVKPDASGLLPMGFRLRREPARIAFQFGFLGRMLFSCLVDADFLDTEAFYAGLEGKSVGRDWPALPVNVSRLIDLFDAYMAAKPVEGSLNRLRRDILDHVRARAGLAPGVFTLQVPTGGGKTLASLAFALEHARKYGKERIIYTAPFTSIIDQTASIFMDVLGADMVLEHHSTIDEEKQAAREGRDKLGLAMENWDAPVIVTTTVQLFESLFSNRPSRCRKLHNIANSVIVLDEAQVLPLPVLRPCVAALDELARNYGCSIVLCTATQPALAAPDFKDGFEIGPDRELAPDPARLHAQLRRTTVQLAGTKTDEDLLETLAEHRQALLIVNGRGHARELYQKALKAGLDGVFHLTTRQIVLHRRALLDEIRQRLRDGRPCRVIATSLVEAGVDLDFPRVWRAEAGMDQIAQAAGRCNREGRRPAGQSIVTVFAPAQARPPAEVRGFAEALWRVVAKGHDDLLAPATLRDYFKEVYWQQGEDGLDKHKTPSHFQIGRGDRTDFAYRSYAEKFRMIESGMEPVIVPADEASKAVIAALHPGGMPPGVAARKLQNYVVQVPPRHRAGLIDNGHVAYVEGFADQFAVLRTLGLYSRELGLLFEDADDLGFDGVI